MIEFRKEGQGWFSVKLGYCNESYSEELRKGPKP